MDGGMFDNSALSGQRCLVSFYRFASCPFCNLRLHQMVARHGELEGRLEVVAIFDSSAPNLRRHAEKHHAPFPILADPDRSVYRRFGIETSLFGMFKGMILRMPTLLKAMFAHGYIPTTIGGSLTSMPADFLIDETGIIQTAYYGRDEGDHLAWDTIAAFAESSTSKPPLVQPGSSRSRE